MNGAGQLRERIRFERRTETDDGFGNRRDGWSAFLTVPASIKYLAGREQVIASALEGLSPVEVVVRWNAMLAEGAGRLTGAYRMVSERNGETYNIRSVMLDPKRRYLTILAETGEPS